ncbi:MAG: hypothetical protein FJ102_05645 [Deltaproteobacteria bacterium]|nr:hypothetical protein [Deltaproteobacteria bacterium]
MRTLLALALAAGCRAEPAGESARDCAGEPCSEVDAHDSGDDPCEEAEVWCDGVDQDCDGADSAEEIPYDGIDQDCDGLDLVDVDGDGFDAEAGGGDDCDDADAGAHPGAMESAGDGADNDCDGHADEVVACPDGSGDALTIQGAIDAAPDGGAVEICPGRWTRAATALDRVLTIYGGGEMPGDTILDASRGTPVLTISGRASVVTMDWLSLQGDEVDDQLVGFSGGPEVAIRRVDISNDGEATAGMIYLSGSCEGEDGSLAITLSRVRGEVWLSGTCVRDVSITGNTLSGEATVVLGWATGTAEFRNNIVSEGEIAFTAQFTSSEWYRSASAILVKNNVFAGVTNWGIGSTELIETADDAEPPVALSNNILINSRSAGSGDETGWLYYGGIGPATAGASF